MFMQRIESTAGVAGPRIGVFGVGGAGGNAVAALVARGLPNVRVIAANTDAQALRFAAANARLRLGRGTTGGLGAGAKPEVGQRAATEALGEIDALLDDTDLCFIAAGMGGGTGTGAAPVIAAAARARGIVTLGIVTLPFAFEGARRAAVAAAGLKALEAQVDAVIVVPNQNLLRTAGPGMTFRTALRDADQVLIDGVCSVIELVSTRALKHVGLAELRAMLSGLGRAVIGFGESRAGQERAARAAEQAIASPHLADDIARAQRVIVAIRGGDDMGLLELDQVISRIAESADPDAELVWGATVSPALRGTIRVSVIAQGSAAPAAPSVAPPVALPADALVSAADAWRAPPPPVDLADIVRPHPPIDGLAPPALRADRWVQAVSRFAPIAPLPPEPAESDLQLMPRQVIARLHPSLADRASGGVRSLLGGLVKRGARRPLLLPPPRYA